MGNDYLGPEGEEDHKDLTLHAKEAFARFLFFFCLTRKAKTCRISATHVENIPQAQRFKIT